MQFLLNIVNVVLEKSLNLIFFHLGKNHARKKVMNEGYRGNCSMTVTE